MSHFLIVANAVPYLLNQSALTMQRVISFLENSDIYVALFRCSNGVRILADQSKFWTVRPRPKIAAALLLPNTLPYISWLHSIYRFTYDDVCVNHRAPFALACARGDLDFVRWLCETFRFNRNDFANRYSSRLKKKSFTLASSNEKCRCGGMKNSKIRKWKTLSEYQQNVSLQCGHGKRIFPPLTGASRSGNPGLVQWLVQKNTYDAIQLVDATIAACKIGNYQIAEILAAIPLSPIDSVDIEIAVTEPAEAVIIDACMQGNLAIAKLLHKYCSQLTCGKRLLSPAKLRTLMNDTNNIGVIQWLLTDCGAVAVGENSNIGHSFIHDSASRLCGPLSRHAKMSLMQSADYFD